MATVSPLAAPAIPDPTAIGPQALGPTTLGPANESTVAREAAAFSDAIQASAVPRASHVAAQINAGIQELSSRLSTWQTPQAAAVHHEAGGSDLSYLTSAMKDAVSGMQSAYVFAIETTLASRGSTEGTKVVNTLLKGQ